ncbi:MAG: hypothetical protein Q9204_009038, partial [Flavoplaca sp. TL-2023a]
PESDAESESDGEEMTLLVAETDPVSSEIPGPEPDAQENDDWNAIPDDASVEYTQSILNQCENILKNRGVITKISDDRLKLIENSLYAWESQRSGSDSFIQGVVNGQLDLTNEIFYAGKLCYGPGMSLDAQDHHIRDFGQDTFNEVAHDSDDASFPIFLDVKGECVPESNGTSMLNKYNVSVVVESILDVLGKVNSFTAIDIGVVTPYAAQVREIKQALRAASNDHDDMNLSLVDVGTVEHWQGHERKIMICHQIHEAER